MLVIEVFWQNLVALFEKAATASIAEIVSTENYAKDANNHNENYVEEIWNLDAPLCHVFDQVWIIQPPYAFFFFFLVICV